MIARSSDFFMELSEALARTSINRLTEFRCLADVLDSDIVDSFLASNGVATLRKRKLPMDAMIWAVIGMALFRTESVRQLINKLDVVLPQDVDYVARSAVTQARKRREHLPQTIEARLLTKTVKGKKVEILTSMTDCMAYPAAEIVDLYSHRWEIELGYREMKQHMLESRFTLRSNNPELIVQELWGVLLAYNLIRYKMILMAHSLKGVFPNQLSFRDASSHIIHTLTMMPIYAPGNVPRIILDVERNAAQFKLEGRRERSYPRCLKASKNRYPIARKKKAAHAK